MKFVSLLQDAKDGVLDLKVVSETAVAGSVLVCVGCFQGEWTGATFQTAVCEQRGVRHIWSRSGALICLTGALASRH